MKAIDIQVKYKNFQPFDSTEEINYLVRTDQKRL